MKKSNLISSVAVAALLAALPVAAPPFVPAGVPAVTARKRLLFYKIRGVV